MILVNPKDVNVHPTPISAAEDAADEVSVRIILDNIQRSMTVIADFFAVEFKQLLLSVRFPFQWDHNSSLFSQKQSNARLIADHGIVRDLGGCLEREGAAVVGVGDVVGERGG